MNHIPELVTRSTSQQKFRKTSTKLRQQTRCHYRELTKCCQIRRFTVIAMINTLYSAQAATCWLSNRLAIGKCFGFINSRVHRTAIELIVNPTMSTFFDIMQRHRDSNAWIEKKLKASTLMTLWLTPWIELTKSQQNVDFNADFPGTR